MCLRLSIAVLALCSLINQANAQKHDRNAYLGQTPPEIVSKAEHWAGKPPPKLADLRGQVVWLHFNY